MVNYKIFSDSSCDIPAEYVQKYDIGLIPFSVSFDKTHYLKDGVDIQADEFYEEITKDGVFASTSLPSVDEYISKFTESVKNGASVICFTLSKFLSGSYQAAVTAKSILLEDYPDAEIEVIDSMAATAEQGLVVLQSAKMKEAGYSFLQNIARIKELMPTGDIQFMVGNLTHLQKGGRIGKAASLAGNILNIKPLLEFTKGELLPTGKARGKKKAFEKIIEATKKYFAESGEKTEDYEFVTGYGASKEELFQLNDMLEKFIGKKIEYPFFRIGITVGNHTGPSVWGLGFIKKFDAE